MLFPKVKTRTFVIALIVCIVSIAALEWFGRHPVEIVRAQNASGAFMVSGTLLLAQCPATVVSGFAGTAFCPTGDAHIYACLSTTTTCATSTAGWLCIAGPGCSGGGGITTLITPDGKTHTGPTETIAMGPPPVSASGSTATLAAPPLTMTP